jgi:NAD(P)-dependent dehydrogenase (short-subunit alcohol dehydrogenase family)
MIVNLSGKVAIVTGSGQGIGEGIARVFANAGAKVVIATRSDANGRAVADSIVAGGGVAWLNRTDVGRREEVQRMVAQTVERFGRVDGLINNAQTFRPLSPIAEVSEGDVDVFYDSGVKGTLWAMQAVYPHMRAQGWGRIVNFASSMGITGGSGFAAYNASKEAIRALTRTAAREWAIDGIVVNAIAPAAATHHGEAGKVSEGYRIFIENCPMKRQGDPELDIGPLAWFLCSDACRYLTGHTFMADGGAFMWA